MEIFGRYMGKWFNRIKNIRKHIVVFNYLIDKIIKKPNIKDSLYTLDKILTNEFSISRYGDGEFKLIKGENLLFQKYDERLAKRLREILISDINNHIVCIPYQIVETNWLNDRTKYFWDNYLSLNRYKIYKLLDFKKIYYDAFITRFYMDYKDKEKSKLILKKIFKLWDNKEIVIIEGEESRLGVNNDLFDNCKSIQRIICPKNDSYDKYDEILNESIKINKNKLILIALGPTATVLAYDLCKIGYRALDIGHVDIEYEWFLSNAIDKTNIKYKFVGEVASGDMAEEIIDTNYYKQIIKRI